MHFILVTRKIGDQVKETSSAIEMPLMKVLQNGFGPWL